MTKPVSITIGALLLAAAGPRPYSARGRCSHPRWLSYSTKPFILYAYSRFQSEARKSGLQRFRPPTFSGTVLYPLHAHRRLVPPAGNAGAGGYCRILQQTTGKLHRYHQAQLVSHVCVCGYCTNQFNRRWRDGQYRQPAGRRRPQRDTGHRAGHHHAVNCLVKYELQPANAFARIHGCTECYAQGPAS